jgi:small neutral amino acid transporter SnatA (MarC family)
VKHNKQEKGELAARESTAVVPLALPLMAARVHLLLHRLCQPEDPAPDAGMFLVVVAFACCSWLIFRAAPCCSS